MKENTQVLGNSVENGLKNGQLSDDILNILFLPFMFLNKYPVLLRFRGLTIVNFGLFAALNTASVLTVAVYYLYIKGLSLELFGSLLWLFPLLGFMVWFFARLTNLVYTGKEFLRTPLKYLLSTGFNYHGGVIGAVLWSAGVALYIDLPLLFILDGLAIGTVLGQFFGRLGCYNYGCCYGKPTHSHFGVSYLHREAKALRVNPGLKGVRLYPSQLITAYLHIIVFLLYMSSLNSGLPDGFYVITFSLYSGISRLLIEALRGDLHHNYDMKKKKKLTTSFLSWLMISGGLILLAMQFNGQQIIRPVCRLTGPAGLIQFYNMQPGYIPVTLLVSLIIFTGYGIHGRKLGTFPFFQKENYS